MCVFYTVLVGLGVCWTVFVCVRKTRRLDRLLQQGPPRGVLFRMLKGSFFAFSIMCYNLCTKLIRPGGCKRASYVHRLEVLSYCSSAPTVVVDFQYELMDELPVGYSTQCSLRGFRSWTWCRFGRCRFVLLAITHVVSNVFFATGISAGALSSSGTGGISFRMFRASFFAVSYTHLTLPTKS